MSLEGTIRDLGLQEVGQLLSLSRKSGTLAVSSLVRGVRAWIRFADGAMVDAGDGEPIAPGEATSAASAGTRSDVEEVILDVLAWREGHFAFVPESRNAAAASQVRIPADAMLVESVRREDAWSGLRDRVPSADVVPSFVDLEPQALPLLRLVPQEWEVLTRVDGQRNLRTLAQLLQRDLLEVAAIVHGLVGTGLLVVREGGIVRRPTATGSMDLVAVELPPARVAGRSPDSAAWDEPGVTQDAPTELDIAEQALPESADSDELWIPATSELAMFAVDGDVDDLVFDPQPAITATVTPPASDRVASGHPGPSSKENDGSQPFLHAVAALALRDAGDEAARRGDFESALSCWSRALCAPVPPEVADRIREAIGLAARLQALLRPTVQH